MFAEVTFCCAAHSPELGRIHGDLLSWPSAFASQAPHSQRSRDITFCVRGGYFGVRLLNRDQFALTISSKPKESDSKIETEGIFERNALVSLESDMEAPFEMSLAFC